MQRVALSRAAESGAAPEERPLSLSERVMWRLNEGSPMNCCAIAGVRGAMSFERLRWALDVVQRRHPLLQMRVAVEDARPFFRRGAPALPLRTLEVGAGGWVAEVERELATPFDTEKGPLARCVWLHHGDSHWHLLLSYHHVLGDAMSGVLVARDVVHAAGTGQAPPELHDSVPLEARLPAAEQGWSGTRGRLRVLLGLAARRMRLGTPLLVQSDDAAPPHERRPRLTPHTFDAGLTEALVSRARAERTTVQAALLAATGLGMLRDARAHRPLPLTLITTVTLRNLLEPPVGPDDVGFFVGTLQYWRRIGPDAPLWELARAIRSEMASDLAARIPTLSAPLLHLIYRMSGGERVSPRELTRRWVKLNSVSAGVTNLGRLSMQTRMGELELEELNVTGALSSSFLCAASTLNERLHLNFAWAEPTLHEEHATRLFSGIVDILGHAVRTA